jgi:hypothetical protein
MSTADSTTIPDELQWFDVRERHGELTAKVGVAELRAAVEWLTTLAEKGVAHG